MQISPAAGWDVQPFKTGCWHFQFIRPPFLNGLLISHLLGTQGERHCRLRHQG